MAGERHGVYDWPGVDSPTEASYTNGHGISPGIAELYFLPQGELPAGAGDLVITDGVGQIVLPDCKADRVGSTTDAGGTVGRWAVSDRRWRWRDLGAISGEYNQLDPHGKLIPWTIRSPKELAVLCLERMGESRYVIDMPPGLERNDGLNLNAFLEVGVNFPPTGTNPPVNWVCDPPALALQRLCDQFGRRIVYNVIKDRVEIVQLGVGDGLPDGSIASIAPGITVPDFPIEIQTVGDPTKYQVRLSVEPMGREWNDALVPINALSYAPIRPEQQPVWTITIELGTPPAGPAAQPSITVFVQLTKFENGDPVESAFTESLVVSTDTNATIAADVVTDLQTKPMINRYVTLSSAGGVITVKGIKDKSANLVLEAYIKETDTPNPDAYVRPALSQPFIQSGPDWSYSLPPLFPGVVEVPGRLTRLQSQQRARDSVWKIFRITGVDVSGKGKVIVPGYGEVDRQQIYMLDERVEQVIPQPADLTYNDQTGNPLILYYYNGYSKSKPAAAFGAVSRWEVHAVVKPGLAAGGNTPEGSQVMLELAVDPTYQTVTFDGYAYKFDPQGRIVDPKLYVELAVLVRDPETNAFERYVDRLPLNGSAPPRVTVQPDVQLNFIPTYDKKGNVTAVDRLEDDAIIRAKYYSQGMAKQYQLSATDGRLYNGIEPIECSGTVQQVTWQVGRGGARTTASLNTEHHPWVAPYPTRRRNENMAAVSLLNDGQDRNPRNM